MNVLDVPCYLSGSIVSSIYGMQQLAQDIDLVIDLPSQSFFTFVGSILSLKLHDAFDENTISLALCQRTAFSLLHLDTLMKVDETVTNNDELSLPRPQEVHILTNEHSTDVRIASVNGMIFFKLYRYHQDQIPRQDGMTNDMEWNVIRS